MNDEIFSTAQEPAFRSTRWSVVLQAGELGSKTADSALNELCTTYWYPVYAFVRRRGHSHHDSVDLTQGFFVQLLEKRNLLVELDPKHGRFRAYLLAAVKNFIASHWRTENAKRRGGHLNMLPIDDVAAKRQYHSQLSDCTTPEIQFERDWAQTLLAQVLEHLQADYERAEKLPLFKAIRPWLVAQGDRLPQARIAEQLGMSEAAVTMSIQRMRQRYSRLVREHIAETLGSPDEVEDELQRLKAVLSDG